MKPEENPGLNHAILDSINRLDSWIARNGWKGYDPYDVRSTKLFLPVCKLWHMGAGKYVAFPLLFIEERFRSVFRSILRVNKQMNPKAMALFASGFLRLYKITKRATYKKKAEECLDWLIKNSNENYSGKCWGYPFDWQSRIYIPKGTPSGVVTSVTAHAFLDAYEILENPEFLRIAESCCNFIMNDLNVDHTGKDKLCFSYTPLDNFCVHNANLFSGSVLIRSYQYLRKEELRELGEKALNYTMHFQRDDGSWYYWAPPDENLGTIDNYHTGFVLECINIFRKVLKGDFKYEAQLSKGLNYYAKNLFLKNGVPKMYHKSVYPIDIHSCAQGIITFIESSDFQAEYKNLGLKITDWSIKNMQDKDGYFYYRIYKGGWIDKTPYIRWGQAWMLKALTCALEKR